MPNIHLDESEICNTVQVDKDRRNECKINPNWGNQNYPLAEGKYHHITEYNYRGKLYFRENGYILFIHLSSVRCCASENPHSYTISFFFAKTR